MQNLLEHPSVETVIDEIMSLKVAELKNVCRSIGLPLSGRKSELQDRLCSYLQAPRRAGINDPFRTPAVNILVKKAGAGEPVPKYETMVHALATGSYLHPVATGHQSTSSLQQNSSSTDINSTVSNQKVQAHIRFKPSPFYNLKRLIGNTTAAQNLVNVRGVATISFKFSAEEAKMVRENSKIKLFFFCGVNEPLTTHTEVSLQFPYPNEIKFNGNLIKDNVRGLKNKIGTAKPADLTPYINWPPRTNMLQLAYASKKEEHALFLYLVEMVETEQLVESVLAHPKIVKPATLQYIKQTLQEEEDEDLMTTSTILSLQCPISYCRIKNPVKSIHCRHLQCFDVQWFIESQRQIPTWQCPVCQKPIRLEDLAVCEFVQDIINSTEEDVEQVEISQDGSWVVKDDTEDKRPDPMSHKNEDSPPIIKPEDADQLSSIPQRASSEPVIISLDSDEEEEGEREGENLNSRRTSVSSNQNLISAQEHTSKSNLNSDDEHSNNAQETDLLDDEDMAFIEELANTINEQETPGQGNEPILPMSSLNVNDGIQSAHTHENTSNATLDPRQTNRSGSSTSSNGTFINMNNIGNGVSRRTTLPNILGSAPLNGNRREDANKDILLPSVSNLTNADSMLFNGNNSEQATSERMPANSSNSEAVSVQTERHAPTGLPALPALPPLPNLPIGLTKSGAPLNTYPPIHDPRRKRPEVSPFLPKKNYKNILPKKRVHSGGGSSPSTPAQSPYQANSNHASIDENLNSDDLIDLTSD